MYLSKIHIEGFRGINSLDVSFEKHLNVIIGDNNTCKTAIIDAFRICMEYGNQQRSIFISPEDFHFDEKLKECVSCIAFDCYFSLDNPDDNKEAALFYELMEFGISFWTFNNEMFRNSSARW